MLRNTRLLRLLTLLLLVAGALVSGLPASAQEGGPTVSKLRIDGAITPVMATYIGRGIDEAAGRGDSAVIIEMDTPGGLSSAMDDIINDILASSIPVIVYVAPEGARAASAGMYITYAAHVAAMAPVTNIGSATPIQLGGEETGDGELSASERKVINDAVARVRELAELRGRNADWAEDAVRDAANVGASEAVDMNIVDFIATDTADLLEQADGREVTVSGEAATVNTAGASVDDIDMSLFERFLQVLVNPNIAFILLSLGTLGLIFELSNPGAIFPGVVGALMMVMGFYALGTLESNAAGFVLLGLAFVLFVAEVFVVSHGLLTIGGIVAFIFGGLLLSNTRNPEVLQISRTLIFTVAILIGLFFLFVVGSVIRTRKRPPAMGDESMVGREAVARTDLDPQGMVFFDGALWQAVVEDEPVVLKGETVRVLKRTGMRLTVSRAMVDAEGEIEGPGAAEVVERRPEPGLETD